MIRMTGGEGWSLSPEESPKTEKKPNPQSPQPKIRLEKRAGKSVTVISGLHTYGSQRLDSMARELKTLLGVGGTVKNGSIEIQGDKAAEIKDWFKAKSKERREGA